MEYIGVFNLPDGIHQLHGGRLPVLLADLGLDSGVVVEQLGVEDDIGQLGEFMPEFFEIFFGQISALEVGIGELDLVGDPHLLRRIRFFSASKSIVGVADARIMLALGDGFYWLRPRDNGF